MTAVIIDDEVDLCLLLKSYLQKRGYNVEIAHALQDGIQKIKDFQPGIIFLDNNLPDGLGWEQAPVIAADFPDVFQYLISAYHPQVPQMPATARYVVMEKPISFADLDEKLEGIATAASE